MVKRLFSRLRHWAEVGTFRTRARQFMAWPVYDGNRLVHLPVRIGTGGGFGAASRAAAPVVAETPPLAASATCEMLFMKLHVEGRFEEMWDMLAEDAQRAWGGIQDFVREMPRLDEWLEILEMKVADVTLLDSWTDPLHERTYSNVARLVMSYRVRQQWKEWTFDRHVHLVPDARGWRTLCYPTRVRTAASR
jgi:hypothetical protein